MLCKLYSLNQYLLLLGFIQCFLYTYRFCIVFTLFTYISTVFIYPVYIVCF